MTCGSVIVVKTLNVSLPLSQYDVRFPNVPFVFHRPFFPRPRLLCERCVMFDVRVVIRLGFPTFIQDILH